MTVESDPLGLLSCVGYGEFSYESLVRSIGFEELSWIVRWVG